MLIQIVFNAKPPLTPMEKHLQEIEVIIQTSRFGEEAFLTDSKTAALRIIELLQQKGFKQEEVLLKVA